MDGDEYVNEGNDCECDAGVELARVRESLYSTQDDYAESEKDLKSYKRKLTREEDEVQRLKEELLKKDSEIEVKDNEIVSLKSQIVLLEGRKMLGELREEDEQEKMQKLQEKYIKAKENIANMEKTELQKMDLLEKAKRFMEEDRKKLKKMIDEESKRKTPVQEVEKWTQNLLIFDENEQYASINSLQSSMKEADEVAEVIVRNVRKTEEQKEKLKRKNASLEKKMRTF